MFFQTISTPGLSLNTYLIGSTITKCCAVIDPSRQIAPYLAAAQNAGLKITHIIETHVHADFVSGALELKQELEGHPVIYCSGMGGEEWIPNYADKIVHDGDCIQLDFLRLQALHTPGHSPEHLSWICYDEKRNSDIPWFIFTGDFLLINGIGRPDLLGEEKNKHLTDQLYSSLFEKIQSLPDSLEIFPSHSSGSVCGQSYGGKNFSTLGYEKLCNPYFQIKPKEEWVEYLTQNFTPYPLHLQKIKQMNLKGPELLEDLTSLSSEGCVDEVDLEELFILDTRVPQKFADFHIKNALNIPMQDSFCQWCSWFVPTDKPLAIITDDHYRDAQITTQLRLVGFDQPLLFIALSARIKSHLKGEVLKMIMPSEAETSEASIIIDVRSKKEWADGHVAQAHHIELTEIETVLKKFSFDQPLIMVCRSGMRSSIAASFLQSKGFQNVSSLHGGMQSWQSANLVNEKL